MLKARLGCTDLTGPHPSGRGERRYPEVTRKTKSGRRSSWEGPQQGVPGDEERGVGDGRMSRPLSWLWWVAALVAALLLLQPEDVGQGASASGNPSFRLGGPSWAQHPCG